MPPLLDTSRIPSMLYGTAWKKEKTALLVQQAIEAGFRGIDVAAQPRHYNEDLVGDALRAVYSKGNISRDQLFLQTKFTWTSGQDLDGIPFDPHATISEQVRSSVKSSLYAFRPERQANSVVDSYIDCLLLHFPLPTLKQTIEAWTTLEEFYPHKIRSLGLCNTSLLVVQVLYKSNEIKTKPIIIQNRFHANTDYDKRLREFCRQNFINYQAFGVLKVNQDLLQSKSVVALAEKLEQTKEATLYALIVEYCNISVLNGTTNGLRMVDDLKAIKRIRDDDDNNGQKLWESARISLQTAFDNNGLL